MQRAAPRRLYLLLIFRIFYWLRIRASLSVDIILLSTDSYRRVFKSDGFIGHFARSVLVRIGFIFFLYRLYRAMLSFVE